MSGTKQGPMEGQISLSIEVFDESAEVAALLEQQIRLSASELADSFTLRESDEVVALILTVDDIERPRIVRERLVRTAKKAVIPPNDEQWPTIFAGLELAEKSGAFPLLILLDAGNPDWRKSYTVGVTVMKAGRKVSTS